MGVKIYPIGVKEKAEGMNRKLCILRDGIAVEKEAQRGLSRESHTLTGLAWDSVRSYADGIQLPLLETTLSWVNAGSSGQTGCNEMVFGGDQRNL